MARYTCAEIHPKKPLRALIQWRSLMHGSTILLHPSVSLGSPCCGVLVIVLLPFFYRSIVQAPCKMAPHVVHHLPYSGPCQSSHSMKRKQPQPYPASRHRHWKQGESRVEAPQSLIEWHYWGWRRVVAWGYRIARRESHSWWRRQVDPTLVSFLEETVGLFVQIAFCGMANKGGCVCTSKWQISLINLLFKVATFSFYHFHCLLSTIPYHIMYCHSRDDHWKASTIPSQSSILYDYHTYTHTILLYG